MQITISIDAPTLSPYDASMKVRQALEDLKNGKMIIVTDHLSRENEGDFILPAQFATTQRINFMAKWGRGLICAPITSEKARELDLPLMVRENESNHNTAFTVSIDARNNISTGISAYDRAYSLKLLAMENCTEHDFVKPGHIFPLIAKDGGIDERPGHTEVTIDLLKMAGLIEVGVICEIMNDEGEMARGVELSQMAEKFDMTLVSIEEIKEYKDMIHSKPANNAKLFNLGELRI